MPGKTVLVVDDDPVFRESVAGTLRAEGYNAFEAADGREGIETIEQLRTAIDLLIVDLALPAVPGVEIIGAVTRHKTPIKIVATSGVFDERYLEMARGLGADVSVQKRTMPRPGKWLELVQRLIGESERPSVYPSNRVVLVVDEEPAARSYVRTILQRRGLQVLESAGGLDALRLTRRLGATIDAIICDERMPGLSGMEFVETVRAEYPAVPVVLLSAEKLPEPLQKPTAGIWFAAKPFVPQQLLQTVLSALSGAVGNQA